MPQKSLFENASACYQRIVEDAVYGVHWPWKSLRISAKFVGRLLDIDVKALASNIAP